MRNLFAATDAQEVKARLAQLTPGSARQWGKMNVAQALAHCSIAMEWTVGDRVPPRMGLASILGRMIKNKVLGDDAPLRRNSPTAKELIVPEQRVLDTERERLSALIDRFNAAGPAGCTMHAHPFFGRLTPNEWAILTYKHLDHHLRQFGV